MYQLCDSSVAALSILHWRCPYTMPYIMAALALYFQYSIGDAEWPELEVFDREWIELSILHWRCCRSLIR